MLVTVIAVTSVSVNVSNPAQTYQFATHNLEPADYLLKPRQSSINHTELKVPNAFIGAQGTYPIEPFQWEVWEVEGGSNPPRSSIKVSGTVTYVSTRSGNTITTQQTISMRYTPVIQVVKLGFRASFNNSAPYVGFFPFLGAGSMNPPDVVLPNAQEDKSGLEESEYTIVREQTTESTSVQA